MRLVTADEALAHVRDRQRVFVQGAAGTPLALTEALARRAGLTDEADHPVYGVEVVHLHTGGGARYAAPGMEKHFRTNALFVGPNVREAVGEGRADYLPVFLSEVPLLFRRGVLPLDVALIHVSPPDKHGFCSLGVSVDVVPAALESAKLVIAQINPQMPRSHGDGQLHVSDIDYGVEADAPLPEHAPADLGSVERAIGEHVAHLVDDGATLQMGIGAIPDAVLASLGGHRHLGIHTEMFSDGVLPLVESGVVDNSRKAVHPGKLVGGFTMGTRRLYDFIDDNPAVQMLDIAYVNNVGTILRNPRVTAINSAIEVDLTGQVCADSIGTRQFSGVGGQMDFIRGASLSEGGKPIIALPSQTGRGVSRIVPTLKHGAGVVTTRAHVHWVVTEYGAVNLYGKNLRQRASALIDIAHPDHREALAVAAQARFGG
jgi:acyl-CoA hydrolase